MCLYLQAIEKWVSCMAVPMSGGITYHTTWQGYLVSCLNVKKKFDCFCLQGTLCMLPLAKSHIGVVSFITLKHFLSMCLLALTMTLPVRFELSIYARLPGSLSSADQNCVIDPNTDHCRSILINSSQFWFICNDQHWEVFRIDTRIFIGIDRHWSLIEEVLIYGSSNA